MELRCDDKPLYLLFLCYTFAALLFGSVLMLCPFEVSPYVTISAIVFSVSSIHSLFPGAMTMQ